MKGFPDFTIYVDYTIYFESSHLQVGAALTQLVETAASILAKNVTQLDRAAEYGELHLILKIRTHFFFVLLIEIF